jgi:hypothetical protein
MPDISKCFGTDCKLKLCCYRFSSPSDGENQSFISPPPFIEINGLINCEQFWFNDIEMIESEELKEIIHSKIEKKEGSGHMAGGSGHLSHKSHQITLVKLLENSEKSLLLYAYNLFIESEFKTREYTHVELVLLNADYQVLNEERLTTKRNDPDNDTEINEWVS